MARKLLKNTVFILSAVILSAILGTALLFAAYLLPVDGIREHVRDSSPVYDREGLTNLYVPWLTSTRMDNYTDSIMLSEAAYKGNGKALNKALLSPYCYVTDPEAYSKPGYLIRMLDPAEENSSVLVSYSRYWHGYLILIKPLLMVTGLTGIRIINAVFQTVMFVLILLELHRAGVLRRFILPLLVMILLVNPVSTALNMQFACIYNITLVFTFILLHFKLYSSGNMWKLFLAVGISVAYFDFLTYPLMSLGIPLIFALSLGGFSSKDNLIRTVTSCFAWGFGYASMWVSKWIICDIVTGSNTVTNAVNQVLVRTVTNAYDETGIESGNVIDVIGYNLEVFRDPLSFSIIAGSVLGFVIFLLVKKIRFRPDESILIPLMLIALMPFAWYVVLSNHSAIHFWMTYRNMAVTVFAAGVIMASGAGTGRTVTVSGDKR